MCSPSWSAFGDRSRNERRLHALVQREQVLDAFTLGREARPAIETIDSAIQRLMRPSEVRRHQVRVVQVRQRRARVGGASVENGLREPLQRRGVRVGEAARQGESPNSRKLFHDTAYNDASAGGRRYY